jgi:hypothetical protein
MTKAMPDLNPDVVNVWEAERDEDMAELTRATQDGTREPSFRAVVISSTGDTVGLQVVGNDLPGGGQDTILYVGGRGTFELVRVERWPPTPGTKQPRVLLKLKAWPSR